MLILFDIDGTMYHGDGSGRAAFTDAGRELFGDRFVDFTFDYSGRLDPWILRQLMRHSGLDLTPELYEKFKVACHKHLRMRMHSGQHNVGALPGVHATVERLRSDPHNTIGLLTGNWEPNGRMKVEFIGFDSRIFIINAWGDDAETREALPPVARQRFNRIFEPPRGPIDFSQIVIIGDTIHDVDCARAHGCYCLGVETGGSTREELVARGAHRVIPDLTDSRDIHDWISSLATAGVTPKT